MHRINRLWEGRGRQTDGKYCAMRETTTPMPLVTTDLDLSLPTHSLAHYKPTTHTTDCWAYLMRKRKKSHLAKRIKMCLLIKERRKENCNCNYLIIRTEWTSQDGHLGFASCVLFHYFTLVANNNEIGSQMQNWLSLSLSWVTSQKLRNY